MKIKKVKVQSYMEHLICENCGGEMKVPPIVDNGLHIELAIYISGPKLYTHVCENCGNTKSVDKTYPRLVYEECEE